MDYYCNTVFEWVTTELGSQGAVCAGGHYDGLVQEMGGQNTPAIGFAIGLERLVALVAETQKAVRFPDAYLVMLGDIAIDQGVIVSESLRDALPELRLMLNCNGGDLGKQLKRADKSGAKVAIIIDESDIVKIKYLREQKEQEILKLNDLTEFFTNLIL